MKKEITGYYNECINESEVAEDAVTDTEAAVLLIIHQFVMRNKFDGSLPEFQDVTPNAWRKRVNEYAVALEEQLLDLIGGYEAKLHSDE